jgi:hypothetical protein
VATLNTSSHAEIINRLLLQANAILGRFIEAIADPADDDRCAFGTVRDLVAWAVARDAAGGGAPKHVEIAQAVLSRNLDAITISAGVSRDELRELEWLLRGAGRLLTRVERAAPEGASLTRH